ncbi:MAG: FAD:protein FMN transferase [Acidobacteriota bacterium]|nr:FAD:protein FMN transferase [Acidobacteriota bacterium]
MPSHSGPPPLRRLIVPGLFVAALFAVVIFRQPGGAVLHERVLTGSSMGTSYMVKVVVGDDDGAVGDRLSVMIENVLTDVDHAMSTYIESSEVTVFNRQGAGDIAVSDALLEVVGEAQRVARLSGGAFDITVGPLVDAWGFGPRGETNPPSDETIGALLAITGFEHIAVDRDRGRLSKGSPEVQIDLSAIAKGFAVDKVVDALVHSGQTDFMVEVGGEVRASGRNADRRVWRIGIERPDDGGRSVHTAVPLANLALATSGDYRNFVVRNGVRVSHTIDPRIGRPISHDLASVSVIHASCMTADALATALEVLGPEEGVALASSYDIPALFLVRLENGAFDELRSPMWSALIENVASGDRVDLGGS